MIMNQAPLSMRESFTFFRRRNKIKLKEIAEYIGCGVPILSEFERGSANLSSEKLKLYKQFIDEFQKLLEEKESEEYL